MKELDESALTKLETPSFEVGQHQVQLRQSLPTAHTDTINVNANWSALMSKKKITLAGAALTLALTIGLSISMVNSNSSRAYAEQLASQGIQAYGNLSPSQQQIVSRRTNGNPTSILQEAELAKNLTVLTYAQLVNSPANPVPPNDHSVDYTSLKYLRFTTSDGTKVTVGVNSQNVPVFVAEAHLAPGAQQ